MQKKLALLFRRLSIGLSYGLLVFCIAFGVPIVSVFSSGIVMKLAGCTHVTGPGLPPTDFFDCPPNGTVNELGDNKKFSDVNFSVLIEDSMRTDYKQKFATLGNRALIFIVFLTPIFFVMLFLYELLIWIAAILVCFIASIILKYSGSGKT